MSLRSSHRPFRGALPVLLPLFIVTLSAWSAGCDGKSGSSRAAGGSGEMRSSAKMSREKSASAALMEAKGRKRPAAKRLHAGDVFLGKMMALIKRACACKDRVCGMKVLGALGALKKTAGRIRLRRGQNAKLQRRSVRFGRCLGRIGVKPAEIMKALK